MQPMQSHTSAKETQNQLIQTTLDPRPSLRNLNSCLALFGSDEIIRIDIGISDSRIARIDTVSHSMMHVAATMKSLISATTVAAHSAAVTNLPWNSLSNLSSNLPWNSTMTNISTAEITPNDTLTKEAEEEKKRLDLAIYFITLGICVKMIFVLWLIKTKSFKRYNGIME